MHIYTNMAALDTLPPDCTLEVAERGVLTVRGSGVSAAALAPHVHIEHLLLRASPAAHRALPALAQLRTLVLTECDLTALPPIEALTALAVLDLSRNRLQQMALAAPQLVGLFVERNQLTHMELSAPQLEVANLAGNPWHKAPCLAHCRSLRRLLM